MFVGITHTYAGEITLFSQVTKRTFIRYSFKHLSDTEPVSTSYIVTDFTPAVDKLLADSVLRQDNDSSSISFTTGKSTDSDDYTYVSLAISCAPSNIRFVYQYIETTFKKNNTNTTYRIHNIVKLSKSNSLLIHFLRCRYSHYFHSKNV